VVDNVSRRPIWHEARSRSADCVVYFATKHIAAGTLPRGIHPELGEIHPDNVHMLLRQTGPSMVRRSTLGAAEGSKRCICGSLARPTPRRASRRRSRPQENSRLIYPGRRTIRKPRRSPGRCAGLDLVAFEVDGDKPATFRFLNALQLHSHHQQSRRRKSLVTHPATTTHQRLTPQARAELGITDGLVRFSAGLEHPTTSSTIS